MTAIQYQLDQRPTYKDLYQFLLTCKESLSDHQEQRIASISLTIESVDLLAVLNSIIKPNQRHFYFEKSGHQEAILGFDIALQLKTEGARRFIKAKEFIETALAKTTQFGDLNAPFSGAHFFCNFSFFDTSEEEAFPAASVFLPAWQIARFSDLENRSNWCLQDPNDRYTVVANVVIDADFDPDLAVRKLWQTLQKIQAVRYEVVNLSDATKTFFQQKFVAPPDQFIASVCSALDLIQADHFYKVVLAQALDIFSPLPLNLVASLSNLQKLYPNCYIFSTSNGNGSTFIGASPERLVRIAEVSATRTLTTDALAGSAPRGKTPIEDAWLANSLLNSQKEIYEHQVVIDSIMQHLKTLGLSPRLAPARLLQLSNIQHLQTPIRARVLSDVHLLDAVAELHPTPAVAGAPRTLACEQIRRFESFERSLYAAPIGWVDHRGNGEFAVGIRSALIKGCQARLFAGAGIVAGSNPKKELAEVQLKLQALLNAIA
ncbi:isochorismate synthase [Myxacorys almedinensis]|uniref:isochorismate synthase n=1 Tax=Myxacorys almedinensis A TaxID=2690445 RepID=A0A8J7Z2B6_9CYAN|nr:isochorismate synthase [Myxacorys almedinensis]NDJ16853.1 isochorismate synthase [Myxacorys almedinensis A]